MKSEILSLSRYEIDDIELIDYIADSESATAVVVLSCFPIGWRQKRKFNEFTKFAGVCFFDVMPRVISINFDEVLFRSPPFGGLDRDGIFRLGSPVLSEFNCRKVLGGKFEVEFYFDRGELRFNFGKFGVVLLKEHS